MTPLAALMSLTPSGALLLFALAWPALLALLWAVPWSRRRAAPLAATLAVPALVLAFVGDAAAEIQLPGLYTSMRLGVDSVGRPFVLLTALLWSVVLWHAHTYVRTDARKAVFTGFMIAAGGGNIGLCLARDALSFYLFFALMSFASYGLVVHSRTPDAFRAGRVYIIMAVLGEALIIAGLLGLMAAAQSPAFEDLPGAWDAVAMPGLVASLLLAGFGVKAGLIPLHLWLPLAHPVAPTPASALLSGAMIKAGVLGWLRFLPLGDHAVAPLGVAVMTAGSLATLLAAAVGVTQRDAKTVLAYSSISQIGFMATGIGAALVLPDAAPLLVLAVAVYALHHAPAKAALFLGVGLVDGRSRLMLMVAAVPALVLAGAPLTSGAVAKVALKAALGDVPAPGPLNVDLLLSLAAVGTTALMARYLALLARAGRPEYTSTGLLAPWAVLVLASGFAAVWLPLTVTPLGELPLAAAPSYVAAAAWPIALGVLLAGASMFLARRYPALSIPRVPAGDIATALGATATAVQRWTAPWRARDMNEWGGEVAGRVGVVGGRAVDLAAHRLDRLAAGPGLGLLLVLVAAALFVALR